MALRTFRFNPALGGFGGESSNGIGLLLESNKSQDNDANNDDEHVDRRRGSSNKTRKSAMMRDGDGNDDETTTTTHNNSNLVEGHHADAFAQIIKELVDNSVDACAAAAIIQQENDNSEVPLSAAADTKRSSSRSSSSNKNTRKAATSTATATATATTTTGKTNTTSNPPNRHRRRLRVRVTIEPWIDDNESRNNTPLQDDDDDDDSQEADNSERRNGEILRVTVLDNGVGMDDIETCVDPFRTTKAHNNNQNNNNNNKNKDDSNNNASGATAGQTAGRYGIGLTLCLLHAQRLVPNSRASIQSTTAQQSYWSVVNCVVDTDGDSVRCFPNVNHKMMSSNHDDSPPVVGRRPKSFATESGTAVSVLVPGGATAALAWPRLAEYFARFKLSRGLSCCLEVLAPTLSKIPLQVVPRQQLQQQQKSRRRRCGHRKQQQQQGTAGSQSSQQSSSSAAKSTGNNFLTSKECWSDFFGDQNFDGDEENSLDTENVDIAQASKQADKEKEDPPILHDNDDEDRESDDDDDCVIGQVCKAAELYLGRPIPRSNVASSIVPIRQIQQRQQRKGSSSTQNRRKQKHGGQDSPQLEVDLIVHGPTTTDDDQDEDEDALPWNRTEAAESDAASMVLVRMVNRIPLLDSAEAIACGLVQGLASKKQMWNTFGLQVTHHVNNHANISRLPVYEVKDSAQVAPFFENYARGGLLDDDDDSSVGSDFEPDPEYDMPNRRKRKPKGSHPQRQLHPAQIRLGNILVIVQIHADPSNLPLPTLSKGRLPFENSAIDTALEVALTDCLRQLQRSNPALLLTAHELRKVERDVRYVPALCMAVASILGKSNTDEAAEHRDSILKWNSSTTHSSSQEQSQHHSHDNDDIDESSKGDSMKSTINDNDVCKLLEARLRHVLTLHEAGNGKKTRKKKPCAQAADEETNGQNERQESNPFDNKGDDAMEEYDDLLGSSDDDVEQHDDPLDLFESSNSNSAYLVSESQTSQTSQASSAVLSRRKEEDDDDDEEEDGYDEWV